MVPFVPMLLQGELSSFPIIFESIANVDNLLEVFSLTLILGTKPKTKIPESSSMFLSSQVSLSLRLSMEGSNLIRQRICSISSQVYYKNHLI